MNNMKKILNLALALAIGFVLAGCSEKDDYSISTTDIITTVTTGDPSAVAASTATLNGVVLDLSSAASSSYDVGVYYSTSQEGVKNGTKVSGTLGENGAVTTTLSGLQTNVTYYYAQYVCLQNKVTTFGEVKSFVTTDAEIATADASCPELTAHLAGTVTLASSESDEVVKGIIISLDEASVKEGRLYESDPASTAISVTVEGLVPGLTYYFVAYTSINGEEKYGEVKSFTTPKQEVEFVDLGLSVEWATVNVGALKPEETGGLYGFGDNTLFKTSTRLSDYAQTDIQESENDIAAMYIDGGFTPNYDQMYELVDKTSQEYAEVNGVAGIRFVAENGNSIFLPYTGSRIGTEVSPATMCAYWTASIDASAADHGSALCADYDQFFTSTGITGANLYEGLAIRPVRMPNHPMNLDYLHQEWSIDLNELGKCAVFDGPLYYYGTDDCWNSVTNGYNISGDTWNWCPVWAENTWLCDAKDRGTMEFKADGTVIVNDLGNGTSYNGTYTVDTENKTISLTGAKILHLENFDALVSNWSTELKVLSLTEHGLQIAALRDQSDEGPCLLVHNFASSSLVGGNGAKLEINNDNLIFRDIEGNGNLRLEIYNEYGAGTKDAPVVNPASINFNQNMQVTFKLEGITDNLKADAAGQYNAALSYASGDWGVSYWGGTAKQDALVNGDGEYTVWMETSAAASGCMVFVVDVKGLANDIADMTKVKAEIVDITLDANASKIYTIIPCNSEKVKFNNKDGNGTDGRIEIYNEYGDTKADPGINQADVHFQNRLSITFTVEGITDNLKADADGSYTADMSYAAASWSPSYWGGGIGTANVTGDGQYTVYACMGNDVADGAVVWCIELYNLWKDLVDTSKVKVTIDEICAQAVK